MLKKITPEKIQEKTQKFAITNNHAKGIVYFKKLLNQNNPEIEEKVKLSLAFMLYHQAFKFDGKKNLSTELKKITSSQIKEAKKILQNLINDKKHIDKKTLLSARIFLAQIYTATKDPKSITLAKENFKIEPSALMANRLADVYDRMNDIKMASIWYKKFEKLAIKEKQPSYLFALNLAIFYKKIKKEKMAEKNLNKVLKNLPNTPEGKSILSILKSHFKI